MSSNRPWILGTVIVAIALVALGWFLGISPKLTEMQATKDNKITIDQANAATALDIAQLKSDFEAIDAVNAQLDKLRESIPSIPALNDFIAEMDKVNSRNDTLLTNFTPATPVIATGTASDPVTVDPNADPNAVVAVPEGTLIAIPAAITLQGDYDKLLRSLDDLQHGTRLLTIDSFSIKDVGGAMELTIGASIYVRTDDATTIAPTVVDPVTTPATEAPVDPVSTETPTSTETPAP